MTAMQLPPSSHPGMPRRRPPAPRRHAQRGATLLFALLTLVALLLATLALVRSVDTSTVLMGNIGFKQDATVTADSATRVALAWLNTNKLVLNTNGATGTGYYSTTQELAADGVTVRPPVDATGQQLPNTTNRQLIDWDGNGCAAVAASTYASGGCTITTADAGAIPNSANTARYVVFRLCSMTGDYTSSGYTGYCAVPTTASTGDSATRGDISYNGGRFPGSTGPFYRIVVRVQGARNTASFTETIVHF
jgi:type IV pilus assembly protein PilX